MSPEASPTPEKDANPPHIRAWAHAVEVAGAVFEAAAAAGVDLTSAPPPPAAERIEARLADLAPRLAARDPTACALAASLADDWADAWRCAGAGALHNPGSGAPAIVLTSPTLGREIAIVWERAPSAIAHVRAAHPDAAPYFPQELTELADCTPSADPHLLAAVDAAKRALGAWVVRRGCGLVGPDVPPATSAPASARSTHPLPGPVRRPGLAVNVWGGGAGAGAGVRERSAGERGQALPGGRAGSRESDEVESTIPRAPDLTQVAGESKIDAFPRARGVPAALAPPPPPHQEIAP